MFGLIRKAVAIFMLTTKANAFLVLLLIGILGFSAPAGAATTYSVAIGGSSLSPPVVCSSMKAIGSLSGTLNFKTDNQEIQESGDKWTWSARTASYSPDGAAPYQDFPMSGVNPTQPSFPVPASTKSTTEIYVTPQPTDTPGFYKIIAKGVDNFNLVDSSTNPPTITPATASNTFPLYIVVVAVGDIQYNDPDNGWISIPSNFAGMKGTTAAVRVTSVPAGVAFPSGQLVWGGIASGSGTTATATFSTDSTNVGDETISVTLGSATGQAASTAHFASANAASSASQGVSRQATTYQVIPKLAPYDMFPNRSLTSLGVGEQALCTFDVKPVSSPMPATFWTIQGLSTPGGGAQGSGQLNGNGLLGLPAIFWAGTTPGSNFTLQLSINSGPSKGKSVNTGNMSIVAPSPATEIRDPASKDYHRADLASAGFAGFFVLSPSNVSFSDIEFGEQNCTATTATGSLVGASKAYHMPSLSADAILYHVVANVSGLGNTPVMPTGQTLTELDAISDYVAFQLFPNDTSGNQWEDSSGIWVAGDATYKIPWMYHVKNLDGTFSPDTEITVIPMVSHVGIDGSATITKGKDPSAKSTRKISDPASGFY